MSKFDLQIDGKFKSITKGNADWYYGGGDEAWLNVDDAKLGIPSVLRSGKTIGVLQSGKIVEYIWHSDDITDNGLVLKIVSPDGSETRINGNYQIAIGGNGTQTSPYNLGTLNPQKQLTYPADFLVDSTYVLADPDHDYVIFINNGVNNVNIKIPTLGKYAFNVAFIQEGTGEVTFTTNGISSILSSNGLKMKGQYLQVLIERRLGSNTYYLLGNTKI